VFGFAAFFLMLYLFPDGRFVPRWTRTARFGQNIGPRLVSSPGPVVSALPCAWAGLGRDFQVERVSAAMLQA